MPIASIRKREPSLQKAITQMDEFCQNLMDERRRNPKRAGDEDLLDMLIEASKEGGINDRQLADLLIFLFVAGYDTSKNVLGWMMREMIQQPEIYARCGQDIEYCRKAVERVFPLFQPEPFLPVHR